MIHKLYICYFLKDKKYAQNTWSKTPGKKEKISVIKLLLTFSEGCIYHFVTKKVKFCESFILLFLCKTEQKITLVCKYSRLKLIKLYTTLTKFCRILSFLIKYVYINLFLSRLFLIILSK